MRLLAILVATVSLEAAVRVGPQLPVTASRPVPAVFTQQGSQLASDGYGYFGVWTETYEGLRRNVLAARLAADGTVLDRIPLIVARQVLATDVTPAIARMSSSYAIGWTDMENVYLRAFDGVAFSDLANIAPVTNSFIPARVRMAWNGSRLLVVWRETRESGLDTHALFGALLDSNLQVRARMVGPALSGIGEFDVTPRDGGFWLAGTNGDLNAWPIDNDGKVREPVTIAAQASVFHLHMASNGTSTLVTWRTLPEGFEATIRAVELTSDGPRPFIDIVTNRESSHAIAAHGWTYDLVYAEASQLYGMLLRGDGTIAEPARVIAADSSGFLRATSVASNGSQALTGIEFQPQLTPDDTRATSSDIFTTAFVPGEGAHAVVPMQTSEPHQSVPAVAVGGGATLIAWAETPRKSTGGSIVAAIAGRNPITLGPSGHNPAPRVAFGGGMFLVVWTRNAQVLRQRIGIDGTLLDPAPVVVAEDAHAGRGAAAAAWDGQRFVVAYLRDSCCPLGISLVTSHATTSGAADQPTQLTPEGSMRELDAASSPNGALLVWRTANGKIEGLVLSPAGFAAAPFSIGEGSSPRVAWNAGRFAITWLAGQARFARITPGGTVTQTQTTLPFDIPPVSVAIAPFGDGFAAFSNYAGVRLNANLERMESIRAAADNDMREVALAEGVVAYAHGIGTLNQHTQVVTQSLEILPDLPRRRAR